MGRAATKASGNVWYCARIEAAKWNDRLLSRAGAAEALSMSEDAVKNTELGLEKCMPVDKAVLMADLYKAPELLNYYCKNNCPIGCVHDLADDSENIDRITVKLVKNLRVDQIEKIKEKLVDIAEDGVVTEDEIDELREVSNYLSELSVIANQLKLLLKKVGG